MPDVATLSVILISPPSVTSAASGSVSYVSTSGRVLKQRWSSLMYWYIVNPSMLGPAHRPGTGLAGSLT